MNKTEIIDLLELVAAVDGRKITEITIQAWLMPLQDVAFGDAIAGLNLCRKDASIGWVEPKHIYAKSKEIVSRRKDDEEKVERAKEVRSGVRCPNCKHDIAIVNCQSCCREMSDSRNYLQTFFDLTGVRA